MDTKERAGAPIMNGEALKSVKERLQMYDDMLKLATETDVTDESRWLVILNSDNAAAMGKVVNHPEIIYALTKLLFRIYRDIYELQDPVLLALAQQAYMRGMNDGKEAKENENDQSGIPC